MKKLLFLGACLVALASQPVMAQTGGPEVVVARFYYGGTGKLHVAIARGTANPEIQELKGSDPEETQFCQKVIAKLYQEGYSLKSTFGPGTGYASTLVFVKEK